MYMYIQSRSHFISLFIFVDGNYPSTQSLSCCRRILDLGGVKVRIGDILVAYFCDVSLWNVVLHRKKNKMRNKSL